MAVVTLAGAVLSAAIQGKGSGATVAGRWTMTVDGGAHGAVTMGLVLEQKGRKVTGTFASPHGDMPVEGEFAGGRLTLATVAKEADSPSITFDASLDGDTLTGYLSSQMGDMTWTAVRAAEK
jgi:hypothetical protein